MIRCMKSFGVLAAVSFVLLFATTVAAETEVEPRIARTVVGSTGLSWNPVVTYESAVLTVSGPGELNLRREFAASEALAFHVFDTKEAALEDGQYAWELRFSPVTGQKVKEALRAARESGNTTEIDALKKQGKLPVEPLVISGYFRIKGGSVVADSSEPSVRRGGERIEASGSVGAIDTDSGVPTKDQVILDDLIVSGSACIGFDCVSGESFGFDTIRIKENNLRIRAVDTSTTSSFPTRDWQITFNDSANGGANKFSIDDIDGGRTPFTIEANARSHSLYVDDYGRVGFGTSTPAVELHMSDGDTPTVRLDQNGSSGWSPQVWDMAGNETNFFIRDASNGSRLPFRIRPGAPTSSIDVAASGNVGIGTASPDAPLDIENSEAFVYFRLTASGASPNTAADMTFTDGGDSGAFRINIVDGDNQEFEIDHDGNLTIDGTVTTASQTLPDYVFKPDYELLPLAELAEFIELEGHLPNVPSDSEVRARGSLNLNEMQSVMLEKIEELTLYTLSQENSLEKLRDENDTLKLRIEALEKAIFEATK